MTGRAPGLRRLARHLSPRRLALLALELLLFSLLVLGAEWALTRDAPRGPAPPLAATLTDSRPFDLAVLHGHPALVYFWASWCPVCALQRGSMDGLFREYPAVTVALGSGDDRALARHLAEAGVSWPVVNDDDGGLAARWGVTGVPTLFVLDPQGEIRFVARGYTSALGVRARLLLARWLAASP